LNTSTRQIGCPFELRGKLVEEECDNGNLKEYWHLKIHNSNRNHPFLAKNLIAHPYARRLHEDMKTTIESLSKSGTKSKHIFRHVKSNHVLVTTRDIYNQTKSIKLKNLAGRTPIKALIDELSNDEEWLFHFHSDTNGHVEYLFMAHRTSIDMVRKYPTVLIMDCTYKTNKFKMPLLDVIGINPCNLSFYVGFCFLKGKDIEIITCKSKRIYTWRSY